MNEPNLCGESGPGGAICSGTGFHFGNHSGKTRGGQHVVWSDGCTAVYPEPRPAGGPPDVPADVERRRLRIEELALQLVRDIADMGDLGPEVHDLPEVRRLRELLEPPASTMAATSKTNLGYECVDGPMGRCVIYSCREHTCPRCGKEADHVLVTVPIERAVEDAKRRADAMLRGELPGTPSAARTVPRTVVLRADTEGKTRALLARGVPPTTEETIDILANPYPPGSADALAWRRGAALADQETGPPDSWYEGDAEAGVDEHTLRMGLRAKRLRDSARPPPVDGTLPEIPVKISGHDVHGVTAVSVTHDEDDNAEVHVEQR